MGAATAGRTMTGAGAGVAGGGPPEESRAALIALARRAGYARVEPAILQPAEPFLELSGEDLRRRMFTTQDESGAELCLRPEYTIPVCRDHLAAGGTEAAYCYLGPVFRQRADAPGEFLQAGLESLGRADGPAADAEILGLALEGVAVLGGEQAPVPTVRLGDVGLLAALLDALDVAPAIRRRCLRAIAAGRGLDGIDGPARTESAYAGLTGAIGGQAPGAARAFVEDVLQIAGIRSVGGRSAGEIAERFLARAAAREVGQGLPAEARSVIERYLAVAGDPDAAAAAMRILAADANLRHPALMAALDGLEERTGFMAARSLAVETFRFQGGFARNLDYYTGFIFELVDTARPDGRPLAGGGRYDRLLQALGAPAPVPAVGCAFWPERIFGAAS